MTARSFLDQPLTTSADSLSNFNRRIVNKYKAGLGFKYLKGYLGAQELNEAIKTFIKTKSCKKFLQKILKLRSKHDKKDLKLVFWGLYSNQ